MKKLWFALCSLLLCVACSQQTKIETMSSIDATVVNRTVDSLKQHYPNGNVDMIKRGVASAASFWMDNDGDAETFVSFCIDHFAATPQEKEQLFQTLQTNFEILFGNYNKISVDLKLPIHVEGNPVTEINEAFGAFDPMAHFSDDMFSSKIAFTTLLNFPFYTLDEKNSLGKNWNRLEWGYARMGDVFNSRIPAQINQRISDCLTDADSYIANYNVIMDQLRTEQNQQLFPDSMKLITHWGLRDELKSNYSNADGHGLEKQQMIYEVMKHIVNQTIPTQVISNADFTWKPYSNKIFQKEVEQEVTIEPDTRYQKLLAICQAVKAGDKYCPTYPTYIQRSFNQAMEVSAADIEAMFIQFISAPEVPQVAALIKQRLGRNLQPFDIWYDGFKSRSTINEQDLNIKTKALYPTADAFQNSLPDKLVQLGFTPQKADWIASKIAVDPSRGAGHAWGAMMKTDKARLRTRIAPGGMDYKGYNIAVHEFGHNVEQTLSLNDVDNYIMNGVPSTAFTEALAFVFQKRDLELLGYKTESQDKEALLALDIFWGCYEIMGVSLVDIYTWEWLYQHPEATAADLKQAVLDNATKVWNKYYSPILGEKNSPILAVYSHMIDVPLYLPNYPYGHIVEFQLEQQFAGKNLGSEILRIYPIGRLTPNLWMEHAVGAPVSTAPLLKATKAAVNYLNSK